MALSDLFSLSNGQVDAQVTKKSPGVYVLDRSVTGGFTAHYAGRSDDDVAKRLKDHVNDGLYKYFKFEYATSSKAAFELECRLYHDLKPPDDDIHPAKPKGTNYVCPVAYCPL